MRRLKNMTKGFEIKCKRCGKHPNELSEYIECAEEEGITPDEYVVREEGTYNEKTGLFYCTPCYVKVGMPLGKA
jgi:aspartate carbamoyltransferase regulatory subunit